jgi:hypothetical protein
MGKMGASNKYVSQSRLSSPENTNNYQITQKMMGQLTLFYWYEETTQNLHWAALILVGTRFSNV